MKWRIISTSGLPYHRNCDSRVCSFSIHLVIHLCAEKSTGKEWGDMGSLSGPKFSPCLSWSIYEMLGIAMYS